MTRAPLRSLLIMLGLWVGARAAILLPAWTGEMSPVPTTYAAPQPPAPSAAPPLPLPVELITGVPLPAVTGQHSRLEFPRRPGAARMILAAAAPMARTPELSPGPSTLAKMPQFPPLPPFRLHIPEGPPRWSASAWLLVRDDSSGAALAPGGTLGGSQAGARLTYALGGGLALSTRFYIPLRQTSGAEAAAGIDWRPIPALSVSLLAERRQRLGRDGRNAFALTVYGGTSQSLTPRTRLDLYGQAGMVGLRSRDLFVDGTARLSRRIGPVEVGAGAWGAAQPGLSRLDAGPSLSWRLPVTGANFRLQADWRFRITGDAAPRSGPALTLAADF